MPFLACRARDFCDLARPDAVQKCETSRYERLKGSGEWRVIRERPQAPRRCGFKTMVSDEWLVTRTTADPQRIVRSKSGDDAKQRGAAAVCRCG